MPRGSGAEWLQLLPGVAVLSDRPLTPSQSECFGQLPVFPSVLRSAFCMAGVLSLLLRYSQPGACLVETRALFLS